jgi:NADH-quinone oxidoreductase subunit N
VAFYELINSLSADTLKSLVLYRPELALVGTIVLILLLKVFRVTASIDSYYVALFGSAIGLWFAIAALREPQPTSEAFTGLLIFDSFGCYIRLVLFLFVVVFCVFTRISGIPDREAATDFYPLVLGATLGMCMMTSANHLLTVFLGVEMASVPSYALAGALKGRRKSSEAALKYAIYGAGAAGVMLYGISLLAGILGSVHIPTMAVQLAGVLAHEPGSDQLMVLVLGGLMFMVGLSFKLSAVPFHFWCPDVFEGASAEINAFLSVASKAAALALLVRVAIGFGVLSDDKLAAAEQHSPRAVAMFNVADEPAPITSATSAADGSTTPAGTARAAEPVPASKATIDAALAPSRHFIAQLLAFIAIITCTFGNLAAYGQTNIKRLLAYSTIAHAGYMIMPVAAAIVLADKDLLEANKAIAGLAFYIAVYLFTNLGAFAVVAFLRNAIRSEEIADYAGLLRRAPVVVVCFCLILVSLIGIPPLAGFFGKFWIFAALWKADLRMVLVIGGLNTAISLYYYLRVIKIMTMENEPESRLPFTISFAPGTFVLLCTAPIVLLGFWPESLNQWLVKLTGNLL